MTYRKKLIEVALPLEDINRESAREKSIRHGHPSTLHLWWARRPLAACRAVIFSSLVDDPGEAEAPQAYLEALDKLAPPATLPEAWDQMDEAERRRHRLFRFVGELVKWENSNDEYLVGTARELIQLSCEGNPPPLLDPFCGGGSIPLEGQRLGLEVHASDLNPVAVLITKALVEIPPKFAGQPPVNPEDRAKLGGNGTWKGAAGLAADVRYYGKWMRDRAYDRIGHLYPNGPNGETVIAWLWARTVKCPNPACGADMPLVRSFWLSKKKKGKEAWVEAVADPDGKGVTFNVHHGTEIGVEGTTTRSGATCLLCNNVVKYDYVRSESRQRGLGNQMLAIVTEEARGRGYVPPDEHHSAIAASAQQEEHWFPESEIADNPGHTNVYRYGLTRWGDLFTPRQLVALTTFSDLVGEAQELVLDEAKAAGHLPEDTRGIDEGGEGPRAYADAVATYLAFAVDRLANLGSSLVGWMGDRGALRETFARQALPMVWDFAEANPFSGSGGNIEMHVGRVADAVAHCSVPIRHGNVQQLDAVTQVDGVTRPPLVITDPPYYDNIGYAELSDFMYVWLRRSLHKLYPGNFRTVLTPKDQQLVASAYRFRGSREKAQQFFEKGLQRAFTHIRSEHAEQYPMSFFYAFKQEEETRALLPTAESPLGSVVSTPASGEQTPAAASTGWESMLDALIHTGFGVTATWPMRSEGSGRLTTIGSNALASSIVLACRPHASDAPTISRSEFLDELGREMREALPVLISGEVAPVDLAQAAIGPGMAVYSRYKAVLRQDGKPVTVRDALIDINNAIAAYRDERRSSFDPSTRFCIDWYEQYGFGKGPYGDADTLSRARNVGVNRLEEQGLLHAPRGDVWLVDVQDYSPGVEGLEEGEPVRTEWDAGMRLCATLHAQGERATAALARALGDGLSMRARELSTWMFTIADRASRSRDAMLFNALDASWSAIQAQAAQLADEGMQARAEL